jgi:hypothetical protein
MRRTTFALLTVLLIPIITPTQLISSTLPNNTSRYLSWMLGFRLSAAALAYSNGANLQTVNQSIAPLREAAEALGTWIPQLPSRSGDSPHDTDEIIRWVGWESIARDLTLKYSPDHTALFELGYKSNLLMLLYVPGDDLGRALASVIADRAPTATLPESLWRSVVNKVNHQASREDVVAALRRMQEDISDYLVHAS